MSSKYENANILFEREHFLIVQDGCFKYTLNSGDCDIIDLGECRLRHNSYCIHLGTTKIEFENFLQEENIEWGRLSHVWLKREKYEL